MKGDNTMKAKIIRNMYTWGTKTEIGDWEKFIAILLVGLTIITMAVSANASAVHFVADYEEYSTVMKVTDIDLDNDIVYVENWNGNVYSFYGVEDWFVGDYCSLVMGNNYTADITDDTIISIRYERIDLLAQR